MGRGVWFFRRTQVEVIVKVTGVLGASVIRHKTRKWAGVGRVCPSGRIKRRGLYGQNKEPLAGVRRMLL